MRRSFTSEKLDAQLEGLLKKDRQAYDAVMAKIEEIVSSTRIGHYKNLRAPLQQFKRVHVMKSFVLVFSYDRARDVVRFHKFDHHDRVYR